jgi:hypothetical protein
VISDDIDRVDLDIDRVGLDIDHVGFGATRMPVRTMNVGRISNIFPEIEMIM